METTLISVPPAAEKKSVSLLRLMGASGLSSVSLPGVNASASSLSPFYPPFYPPFCLVPVYLAPPHLSLPPQ